MHLRMFIAGTAKGRQSKHMLHLPFIFFGSIIGTVVAIQKLLGI